jgi:hypothetical protein
LSSCGGSPAHPLGGLGGPAANPNPASSTHLARSRKRAAKMGALVRQGPRYGVDSRRIGRPSLRSCSHLRTRCPRWMSRVSSASNRSITIACDGRVSACGSVIPTKQVALGNASDCICAERCRRKRRHFSSAICVRFRSRLPRVRGAGEDGLAPSLFGTAGFRWRSQLMKLLKYPGHTIVL